MTVNISGGLTPQGAATWAAIADLARRVPVEEWMIVGGQMVAIHSAESGRDAPRPTTDGDIVVDVRRHSRDAMQRVTTALLDMGFQLPDQQKKSRRSDATTAHASTSSHPTA